MNSVAVFVAYVLCILYSVFKCACRSLRKTFEIMNEFSADHQPTTRLFACSRAVIVGDAVVWRQSGAVDGLISEGRFCCVVGGEERMSAMYPVAWSSYVFVRTLHQ